MNILTNKRWFNHDGKEHAVANSNLEFYDIDIKVLSQSDRKIKFDTQSYLCKMQCYQTYFKKA